MELSETLFSEIIGVNAQPPIYGPTDDRRRYPRVMFGCRARIFPLIETAGGNGCPVLIRDISRTGIGFLFSHPLEVGDEFILHLPKQTGHVVQVMCIAQRCERGGSCGKHFVIGATLELVLESDGTPVSRTISHDGEDPFAREATDWPTQETHVGKLQTILSACWNRCVQIATFDRSASQLRKRLKASGTTPEKVNREEPKLPAPTIAPYPPDAISPAPFPPNESNEIVPVSSDRPRVSLFKKKDAAEVAPVETQTTPVAIQPAAVEPVVEPATSAVIETPPPAASSEIAAPAPIVEQEKIEQPPETVLPSSVDVIESAPVVVDVSLPPTDLHITLPAGFMPTQPRRNLPFHVIRAGSRRRR